MIEFRDYKERIVEALERKLKETPIPGEDGFTILEGFILQILNQKSSEILLGSATVPIIGVVGGTSGRVYFFALKALGILDLDV